MTEQKPQPEKEMAAQGSAPAVEKSSSVVKNTAENREENGEKVKKAGNNNPKGINQYTGTGFAGASYHDTRTMMKIYYENHPEMQARFVEKMAAQAAEDPQWAKLVIQMTGGFDPTETKISGEVTQVVESPLNSLTIEELRALKALKKEASDAE